MVDPNCLQNTKASFLGMITIEAVKIKARTRPWTKPLVYL